MDLFKLVGSIVVNNSEANKALDETSNKAKETAENIGDMAESGGTSGGKFGSAMKKVGSVALGVGKTVAAGLAVGGAAMGTLTVKALNLGGELEQNMGGSEAVFKEHAGKMQETAKKAFSNMGLSTSDFLGTANKMGALFQGAGFDIETSATMSAEAMQRAADVASVMGIDTASAMEAIAGAAKGNFTMMDNLGVAMNDTTLQAYALEKGITKSTTEMTNQEKIGLAMEMFMEKTAYAAGRYADENETLAGSLGTAKSALTNFLDGSGSVDQLVDAFFGAANVIVKNLKEIAPRLISGLQDLVNQVLPLLPPLLNQLLPACIEGAVGLINGLVSALPAVLDVLTNSAFPMLLSGIGTIFEALISALPGLVGSICSALPTLLPLLINGLVSMVVMLCTNFSAIIQPIIDILPDLIVSTVNALISNAPALIMGLVQLAVGIAQALPQILSAVWTALVTLAEQGASNLFDKIAGWIRQMFPKSAETIFAILRTIKAAFSTLVKNIGAILSVVVSVISTPFKLAWNGIKLVWNNAVAFFQMIWNNIKAIFSVVDSVLSGDFKGAWEGIKKIWSNVAGFFKQVVSNVKNAFSKVGEILTAPFRKGRDAIKKIVDNIKGFFSGLKLNFPKIKLPHFGISPKGWKIGDLLDGSIPKLKIDWYARGGIMKQPTMFDYNPATGRAKVGGEAGDEAIAPIETLMQYVRAAVQAENAGLAQMLERIINLLVQFFPEMLEALDVKMYLDKNVLVAATAADYDSELGKIAIKKGRGR